MVEKTSKSEKGNISQKNKNHRFWKYLTALCGFTFCRIYVTQQKGAFEAAVNLDILQKFSHQGQFRALEFILASTLSDHQKGSLIHLKIKF